MTCNSLPTVPTIDALTPGASTSNPALSETTTREAPEWLRELDLESIPWIDVVAIDDVGGDAFHPSAWP